MPEDPELQEEAEAMIDLVRQMLVRVCKGGWVACPVSSGDVSSVEILVIFCEYQVGGLEVEVGIFVVHT